MGMHVSQHIPIDSSDEIIFIHPVKDFNTIDYITHFTSDGQMKKTEVKEFEVSRHNKVFAAIKLKKGAEVRRIIATDGSYNVMIVSKNGLAVSFPEDQVNPIGVRAGGVKGINLKPGDELADATIFHPTSDSVLLATNKGNMKRIRATEFLANRANRGMLSIKDIKSNPHEVANVVNVGPNDIVQYYINNEIAEIVAKDVSFYERNSIGKNVCNFLIEDMINKVEYVKVVEKKKRKVQKKKIATEAKVMTRTEIKHESKDLTIDDFLDDL
jgi:topoisomerase-4 subunit A